METKICKECGEERPLSDFKMTRNGNRASVCICCVTAKLRETKANKRAQMGGVICLPFPTPTSTISAPARSCA